MAHNNYSEVVACQTAAQESLLNAAQNGFQFLNESQPLVANNSSSAVANEMMTDLAARQIEHCLESWHYLSQALSALLNGRDNIAIHLAYYSELRAANSLFASTGIAIKTFPNYYINYKNRRRALKVGTHKAIREIWPMWCARADAMEAFRTLKVAPSTSLSDISDAMGLSGPYQNSLVRWGYELVHFRDDHTVRNISSYNATKIYECIPPIEGSKYGNLISLIWSHMASTGISGQFQFEQLYSKYLIWCYCIDFATGNDGDLKTLFQRKFDEFIEALSKSTGSDRKILKAVLDIDIDEDYRFYLFHLASSTDGNVDNIIARAFILARLSTNKLNTNLFQTKCAAGYSWIKAWLKEAGIISEDVDINDICASSDEIHSSALELSEIPIRDIWEKMAYEAMRTCRVDTGLCWGFDL